MSFAISWEADEIQAGGFLLFDAVTSWNRSFTGQPTKHPVDAGGNVTDHYIKNNPVFKMSAVISGADLSTSASSLQNEEGDVPYNTRLAPTEVVVGSGDQSLLMRFIPNVVGQFLPDTLPDIIMDDSRGDTAEEIQDILVNLQSGEGYNQITGQFETLIRPVILYETSGFQSLVRKLPADNNSYLVITSIDFKEDSDSGYALYVDITFESVRFANLKKVQLSPDLVQTELRNKVADKKSLGKGDSTETDVDQPGQTPDKERKSTAVKAFESGQSLLEGLGG